jgi:hypothetical protein
MPNRRSGVLALFLLSAGSAGCGPTGLLAHVKPEPVDEVDGFPFSRPALIARNERVNRFTDVKRVVPLTVTVRTSGRNPWVHPSVGFMLDDHVLEVATRVLAQHGITLVSRPDVLDDPVYKAYDRRAGLAGRVRAALGLMAEPPGFAPRGSDGAPEEALVEAALGGPAAASGASGPAAAEGLPAAPSFDDAAKKAAEAAKAPKVPEAAPAIDPSMIDDPKEREKAERAVAEAKRRAPPGNPLERIQRTLAYVPASIARRPDRATMLGVRPSEWAASEPEDGFVAQVLGSTRSDAAVVIDLCIGFDVTQNIVGLCGPSSIVFYGPSGKVMQTPLPVLRPQPDPTADEVYYDPPQPPLLLGAAVGAFAKPVQDAMRDAQRNWRIAFRTAFDLVRAAKGDGGSAGVTWNEQRAVVLQNTWRPTPEALAPVDQVVEKLLKSVLRQLGRNVKP